MTILLFLVFSSSVSTALERAGEITKYEGSVAVYSEGNVRGKTVREKGYELQIKDIVKTKRSASALIRFLDDSNVLLKEDSILEVEGIKWINLENGRVIFNVKDQRGLKGTVVKAKSVVIGVKGTTFLVDRSGEKLQVFLKEGRLNIQSLEEDFVRYRKKEMEEYDKYRKKELEEFDKYKTEMEEEFKEFVKEFEMSAGTAIVIDKNEVRDQPIPQKIEEEFNQFFKEIGEI